MKNEMSELETYVQFAKIGIAICFGVVFFVVSTVALRELKTIREHLLSTDNACQQAGRGIY